MSKGGMRNNQKKSSNSSSHSRKVSDLQLQMQSIENISMKRTYWSFSTVLGENARSRRV